MMKKMNTMIKKLKESGGNQLKEKIRYGKINNKGFSFVEIIVVLVVLGTILMLAVPKFIGYKNKTKTTLIQNDIKVMEGRVAEDFIKNAGQSKKEPTRRAMFFSIDETYRLADLLDRGNVYDVKGIVEEDDDKNVKYEKVTEDFKSEIRTRLKGEFYSSSEGRVLYSEEAVENMASSKASLPGEGLSDKEIEELIDESYIPIADIEDLKAIGVDKTHTFAKGTKWEGKHRGGASKDKAYVQVQDIDLKDVMNFEPIGINSEIGQTWEFNGSYNGGKYLIDNLTIDRPESQHVGFFGFINGSVIKNVKLTNVNVKGQDNVGGLTGYATDKSELVNCSVTGKISGVGDNIGGLVGFYHLGDIIDSSTNVEVSSQGNRVGGLVGYNNNGNIKDSISKGTIKGRNDVGGLVGNNEGDITKSNTASDIQLLEWSGGGLVGNNLGNIDQSYTNSEVEGRESNMGGLVGINKGRVSNSYADGRTKGSHDVGGLVGDNDGVIESSYSVGLVIGDTEEITIGGLIGKNSGKLKGKSYYNKETSHRNDKDKGVGLTTAEMKNRSFYDLWDSVSIWRVSQGSYPALR